MKGTSQYLGELKKDCPGFEQFIDKLPPNRRHVIEERLKGRTLREIAKDLDVTWVRVRQIEFRVCNTLRWYARERRK